jgi:hypothetical protein
LEIRGFITSCSLGLTAEAKACMVRDPGSWAVFRECFIEGSTTLGGSAMTAQQGGSITLEGSKVDVGGVQAVAMARDPGEGLGLGGPHPHPTLPEHGALPY